MDQETFIVAFDGHDHCRGVIDFAKERAKRSGAKVHVVHVLEWSPFSFMTPEEIAERHKHREAELKRGHEEVLDPVVAELKDAGLEVEGTIQHGSPAEVISDVARAHPNSLIFCGRSGASSIAQRVLGSATIALVQVAPVPVVVVP